MSREIGSDGIKIIVEVAAPPHSSSEDRFRAPNPVFDWAERQLFLDTVSLLKAQLAAQPHDLGEDFILDSETGEYHPECKAAQLLHLLETSEREEVTGLMRSPDVIRIIEDIRTGKDQKAQRRLQEVLRAYSVPRPGAPVQEPEDRWDLYVAMRVAAVESEIAAAHAFVTDQKRRGGQSAWPENIEAALVRDFNMSGKEAVLMVRSKSRTLRGAAYRMVAQREKRTVDAVKMAATRGAKHPHFKR